jgi:hypothetical protein
MEALALPSLGMPDGAFILTLDGCPTPRKTTDVFAIVQQDVSWQEFYEQIMSDRNASYAISWYEMRCNKTYIINVFPQAVRA